MAEDSWTKDQAAVYQRLKSYNVIDDIDGIPLDAFVMAVGTIVNFKRQPVTDNDTAKAKGLAKQQLEKREILDRAAEILQDEIDRGNWKNMPSFTGHVQQWSAAVALLKMPRGITEMPGSWMRGTKQGSPMRAWTYMATEIMGWILFALKSNNVELRNAAGLARFARDALAFIGVIDLPREREILKALQKHLIDREGESDE